jgi:hypothetical protein
MEGSSKYLLRHHKEIVCSSLGVIEGGLGQNVGIASKFMGRGGKSYLSNVHEKVFVEAMVGKKLSLVGVLRQNSPVEGEQ